MHGHVLISSDTGRGRAADEARLAAAVRVLERGQHTPLRILTPDLARSRAAHPSLTFVNEGDVEQACRAARLLVVIGDLTADGSLARAATHTLHAKLARAPVALMSVRVAGGDHPDLRFLAQAESISVCDGQSAHVFAKLAGRRVPTTAPLELVLGGGSGRPATPTISLEAEFVDTLSTEQRQALLAALLRCVHDDAARVAVICSAHRPAFEIPNEFDCIAAREWPQWTRALGHADVCIGFADGVALHVAAAHGAVPLSDDAATDLHERLGLRDRATTSADSWARRLRRARRRCVEEMRSRCAPLRVVAWRALGPLSDAVRSHELVLDSDAALRRRVAELLVDRVTPFLESGDFQATEEILSPWTTQLGREPRWAEARARAWVLQGRDDQARDCLENALGASPQDGGLLAALAMVLYRLGDAAGAKRCWQQVAEVDPSRALQGGESLDFLEHLTADRRQQSASVAVRRRAAP